MYGIDGQPAAAGQRLLPRGRCPRTGLPTAVVPVGGQAWACCTRATAAAPARCWVLARQAARTTALVYSCLILGCECHAAVWHDH